MSNFDGTINKSKFRKLLNIRYEQWDNLNDTTHPNFLLGELIDSCEKEAVNFLQEILNRMLANWLNNLIYE